MALASFFDRTEESLLNALQIKDASPLLQRLESVTVGVVFNDSSLKSPNTSLTLLTTVNLLARLYSRVSLVFDGSIPDGKALLGRLRKEAVEINPKIDITGQTNDLDVAICVGKVSVEANLVLYVMSDGWNVEISTGKTTQTLAGIDFNPISATGAACFGAAEVFRHIFSDFLPQFDRVGHYTFSFLDYSRLLSPASEFPQIYLKDFSLVGLGAVGNAALWCLSNVPSLRGTIHLVDPEAVELSNLQRYILTKDDSVGRPKTALAVDLLRYREISAVPHEMELAVYAQKNRPGCYFDVMAIAVDNREDRVSAQALLPRIILNAWTGNHGNLGASRHGFDSQKGCLACLYPPKARPRSYLEELSLLTGFSKQETYNMLHAKVPLGKEHLRRISVAKGYSLVKLRRWQGRTIESLYREGICGGMLIKHDKEIGLQQRAIVPLAHQSVLAGTLLAAEIVKESMGLALKDGVEVVLDVLNLPPDYAVFPARKAEGITCICEDKDYLDRYREKYQMRENTTSEKQCASEVTVFQTE